MNQIDHDALTRAIELCRAEDAGRRKQIDDKLADESFEAVGRFAAYVAQTRLLHLAPWESPPCRASGGESTELLRRLIGANLSRYEPDPLRALERAEAEQRQTAK